MTILLQYYWEIVRNNNGKTPYFLLDHENENLQIKKGELEHLHSFIARTSTFLEWVLKSILIHEKSSHRKMSRPTNFCVSWQSALMAICKNNYLKVLF